MHATFFAKKITISFWILLKTVREIPRCQMWQKSKFKILNKSMNVLMLGIPKGPLHQPWLINTLQDPMLFYKLLWKLKRIIKKISPNFISSIWQVLKNCKLSTAVRKCKKVLISIKVYLLLVIVLTYWRKILGRMWSLIYHTEIVS